MNFIKTEVDGGDIIEPKIFEGVRGYFFESYREFDFGIHDNAPEIGSDWKLLSDQVITSETDTLDVMNLSGLKCKFNTIPSSAYPAGRTRPFYSVLGKEKIESVFNIKIPHWKERLVECLKQF